MKRELTIAFRSRLTWLAAALSALVTGHGFVLAVDLFSSASRSVAGNVLMARELDVLSGVVRPTLGGLYLAASLLAPLIGARAFAVDKERRTFEVLLLQTGSAGRVVLAKLAAALVAGILPLCAPVLLFGLWAALGGHLALPETLVAVLAHALNLMWMVALGAAAAAWVPTLAQAVTVALVVVAGSWALDASEGFAALAWLSPAMELSVSNQLLPLERGALAFGTVLFFAALLAGAVGVALCGAEVTRPRARRAAAAVACALAAAVLAFAATSVKRSVDVTEHSSISFPPAMVSFLRTLPKQIEVEVELDRDDARRRQLESDFLFKLRLARPGASIRFPPDERTVSEAARDEVYGRVTIRVDGAQRETTSISRRELSTLLCEAAGAALPDWSKDDSPGYPLVVEGGKRSLVRLAAWLLLPGALALLGFVVTRNRRRTDT